MIKKFASVLALMLCVTGLLYAQDRGKNEIGIQAGGFFYTGDLTPDLPGSFKTARPAVGIYYNRYLGNYFSLRANLNLGSLFGDDSLNDHPSYMRQRNFRFHSPVTEVSLIGQFDIFGTNGTIPPNRLSPYVFAGIGASFLDVQRDWSRTDTAMIHVGSSVLEGLTADNLHGTPKLIAVVPVGVGVKFHAWEHIALTAEASYRFSFTDYIDGFSYAANPNRRDGYFSLMLGAVYNFGNNPEGRGPGGPGKKGRGSVGCPSVRVF